ncbi:hypothetical protein SAMN05661008_00225 [Alkalithermobacter thermoalcaliphilus JW-YL-7 = DSM 7308]|uniref:Uncharacterized protein n=1 Tax=Alkalithermobacter thermoalcaliphilus JW-YL-7 = DSM 7308 TaxID=1121328 RepID=A0A150FRI3_CLOPD|nr:hypothetical protein JWYL7_1298 [[Clostridium] paradoxum JW-YL-7 = DSM 7308]SHK42050.1 hypothetical protein SAMN05661008_00225 [[Clostridium] paradoxum JW-YL-7 = DSM 7308]
MENFKLVLMEKEKDTGFLYKEREVYSINTNLVENIYVVDEDGKEVVHLIVTTDKNVSDWEFSAIFDYYDVDVFQEINVSVKEIHDKYNPAWEIKFEFIDCREEMENLLNKILDIHKKELDSVYEQIKDKEEEYK